MKASELLKLLKRDDWYETRQTGSHVIMTHPEKKGQLIVPYHGSREVPTGTLNAILKEANVKTRKR